MNLTPLRVGITPTHRCSYLPDQYEQLIVLVILIRQVAATVSRCDTCLINMSS